MRRDAQWRNAKHKRLLFTSLTIFPSLFLTLLLWWNYEIFQTILLTLFLPPSLVWGYFSFQVDKYAPIYLPKEKS